jgi:hypothetical protein
MIDLTRLKELERAATAAPWRYSPQHIEEGPSAVRAPQGWAICHTSSDVEAEFIAALRNAAPSLIAQAERVVELEADLAEAMAALRPFIAGPMGTSDWTVAWRVLAKHNS